ncbi:MAG TPA: hypothetical protein VG125_12940 [Pirellulales bacterium]|jgi:hypothetical protein|nr:hypothetical protein [Pirellulales bacterium]
MKNFWGGLTGTMLAISISATTAVLIATSAAADDGRQPFLPDIIISSTVPANGDLNPYGVAIVPQGFPSGGTIMPGDVLVSNFNNSSNTQGTGTTIVKLTPNGLVAPPPVMVGQPGNAATFFQGPTGLGLTTALGVLKRGFVLVGNVPTNSAGMIEQPGSLLFLNRNGTQIASYTNQLNGPWDLTVDDEFDHALVFVSNVNTGTVTRLNLTISSTAVTVTRATVIATGYTVALNSAALILGPTGLAYDAQADILYVASTNDNEIFAVPHAGSRAGSSGPGTVVFRDEHLRGPLALVFAPNGDLLTANGDAVNADPTQPSEIVEFTKTGQFVTQFNVDAAQGGAFGIAVAKVNRDIVRFVVVDDVANDMTVFDQSAPPGY